MPIIMSLGRVGGGGGGGGGVIRINYVLFIVSKKVNKALSDKCSFFN